MAVDDGATGVRHVIGEMQIPVGDSNKRQFTESICDCTSWTSRKKKTDE